jgi:outer membrane receptor protein involved in Fe transport
MMGLRLENYSRGLEIIQTENNYKYSKFNLFPSLHISHQFTPEHQIQASYSKRVNRPHDRDLNPFPDYIDQYYISTGNPKLEPEYTDAYELNYSYNVPIGSVNLETYYRQTLNSISRLIDITPDNKIWMTSANISKDYTYGAGLSVNLIPAKWFRFTAVGNYFRNSIVEYVGGADNSRFNNTYDMNMTTTIIPQQSTIIQFTGNFNGPRIFANYGSQKSFYSLGFAIRQDFFNRKLSVTLRGQDILNSAKYNFANNSKYFTQISSYEPEHSVISLGITYIINDYRRKQRDTSTEVDMNGGGGAGGF